MQKKIALVLLALLVMTTAAMAKGYEVNKPAGPYNVAVTLDKNPPVTGNNAIAVTVKDAAGKAVTDAKVGIDYGMPGMPGMPAMNYKTAAALKGQAYGGTLNFSMPGAWNVTVKITKGGKTESLKFNVDVQ